MLGWHACPAVVGTPRRERLSVAERGSAVLTLELNRQYGGELGGTRLC